MSTQWTSEWGKNREILGWNDDSPALCWKVEISDYHPPEKVDEALKWNWEALKWKNQAGSSIKCN